MYIHTYGTGACISGGRKKSYLYKASRNNNFYFLQIGSIIPFSLIKMVPVNCALQDADSEKEDVKLRVLIRKWGRLHEVSTIYFNYV